MVPVRLIQGINFGPKMSSAYSLELQLPPTHYTRPPWVLDFNVNILAVTNHSVSHSLLHKIQRFSRVISHTIKKMNRCDSNLDLIWHHYLLWLVIDFHFSLYSRREGGRKPESDYASPYSLLWRISWISSHPKVKEWIPSDTDTVQP